MSNYKEKIEQLSKNSEAQKELEALFEELQQENRRYRRDLSLLESAIENDYDSILITELDLEEPGPRIVYVNEGFTRMTGYSRDEVIGKTPRILQGPKTDREVLDKLKKRLQEGKPFFGQAVNYRKDGSEFVNQWDIHPLTDEEGNLTHWVSYQHDITERKRAEKVLVDTQQEFDGLRESSQKTLVDVDIQGNIVMANKQFRELVGYSKDELKQIKAWELFPNRFRSSVRGRFDNGAGDDQFGNQQFKVIVMHKSGVPIQVEAHTEVLNLKEGMLIRTNILNISLQKRIMEMLDRRNRDYERIVEQASEFTYRLQLKDGEPVFETFSEEFPVFTGVSPTEATGEEGYKAFVHDEDQEKVCEHYRKVLDGKSSTCTYRIQTADNGYMTILDYAKPEWDGQQESVSCICGAVSKLPKQETAF